MLVNTCRLLISFLFVSCLVLLAGCEPAPDEETSKPPKFLLLSPKAGSSLLDTEGQLKVAYSGSVTPTTISVVLNGVELRDRMVFSNGRGRIDLIDIRDVLILGANVLVVSTDVGSQHFSETFRFFFDDQKPYLEITSVTPLASGVDGRPLPGTSLLVQGNIVDVSNIVALNFTYPGGTVQLTESMVPVLANDRYTNIRSSVDGYRKFRVVLPNYPDVAVPTDAPHFSYTVVDFNGQFSSESFLASATQLSTKLAAQVNDGFFDSFNSLANAAIQGAIAATYNVGGPEELAAATFDSYFPAPALILSQLQNLQGTPFNASQYAYRAVASAAFNTPNTPWCDSSLINPALGAEYCVIYIKEIHLDGLQFDTLFRGNLYLDLILRAQQVGVTVEIAAIDDNGSALTYLGGIHGTMALLNFPTVATLKISPDPQYFFKAERAGPISIDVTQIFGGPGFSGYCDANVCKDPATLAWATFFYNIGWDMLDSNGNLAPDGIPDTQQAVAIIQDYLNAVAAPVLDQLFDPLSPQFVLRQAVQVMPNPAPLPGAISSETVANRIYSVLSKNAMTLSRGNFQADPGDYTASYLPVNGGLGSRFQPQGCYIMPIPLFGGADSNGCGTAFREQINNSTPLDLAFAIPANAINQYLLAGYQTGRFDNLAVEIPGSYLTAVMPGVILATDTLNVALDFSDVPRVSLTPKNIAGSTACIWFFGERICTNDGNVPGSIKVIANDLVVSVANTLSPSVELFGATVDAEFEVYITSSNGLPIVSLKDDSVRVRAKTVPVAFENSRGLISDSLSHAVEEYLLSDAFQDKFKTQNLTLLSQDLFGAIQFFVPGVGNIGLDYLMSLSGALPQYYGVIVRTLEIAENGSYLSVGIDVHNSATAWTPAQEAGHYLNVVIQE